MSEHLRSAHSFICAIGEIYEYGKSPESCIERQNQDFEERQSILQDSFHKVGVF